jgi:hypothetical protein
LTSRLDARAIKLLSAVPVRGLARTLHWRKVGHAKSEPGFELFNFNPVVTEG